MFLLSLDEMERVKRVHALRSFVAMEERTHVSERTWRTAFKSRRPTPQVLDALGALGARSSKILIWDEPSSLTGPTIRQQVPA
jgi:hypothetical protein